MPNANVRRVIDSIPLLLSVNESRIPGFVEGKVPYGIVNYVPSEETLNYIKARFHTTKLTAEKDNAFIEMLAVMGSVGTIAYTKESDFDYWVCVDKRGVSKEMLNNFQKKIEAIQNWVINEIKIDVHLFINDIESIQNNIFAEDENEAFGTTIGAVLKDEFFRSSIIIAGKVPFWWVIPRFITDNEYEKWFNTIPEEIRVNEFVDLGNLYDISKEDFMGAALFQLIKSLGNPFKSIIKIGVLEKYLFGTDDSPLLSQKVKLNMLHNNFNNKILDSYILMFEEVYNHYETALEDKNLLKILRQNLYLKINPQLSKYAGIKNKEKLPYKVNIMFNYIKKWGWNINDIKDLDNFNNWDYNKVMTFWNMVKKFMLLSYQKIAKQLPTLNIAQRISESDFKLISRKIKTHFSSELNKIDNYVTFKDIPYESILYIEPLNKSIDDHQWRLYKRDTSSEDRFISTTLRIENDLIKLLAWTSINEIFHPRFSRLKIQSGYSRINQNLVTELLTKIYNLFSNNRIYLKNEYFLNPAFNIVNAVLLNFNMEKEDDIKTIHFLYKTSWGESYIEEHHSIEYLMTVLERVLRDGIVLKKNFDDYCLLVSPESFRKNYKEIETLFKESYNFIVSQKNSSACRMIAHVGDFYVSISRQKMSVTVETFPNLIKLYTSITLKPMGMIKYKFFSEDSRINILREIYKIRTENSISIIYEENREALIIYILNEKGNIFTFIRPIANKEEILMYIYGFSYNVIRHVNSADSVSHIKEDVFIYRLAVDKFEKHKFENQTRWFEEMYLLKYKTKKPLSVIIKKDKNKKNIYKFHFSQSLETDFVLIEEVPRLIMEMRSKGLKIANMVDDLSLEKPQKEELNAGSTIYFIEKYRLELLIDRALKAR